MAKIDKTSKSLLCWTVTFETSLWHSGPDELKQKCRNPTVGCGISTSLNPQNPTDPLPPDPINHLCSVTDQQISEIHSTYRSVQYLKSWSGHFILQNLIFRTRVCCTGFITQPSCVRDFQLTAICHAEMICILVSEKIGDSLIKSDMKLGPQTYLGAESQS